MTVRAVAGVPDWFVKLWHRIWRRRCRKVGHVGPPIEYGVCVHCGYIWFTPEDPVRVSRQPWSA